MKTDISGEENRRRGRRQPNGVEETEDRVKKR
jgi:hypothetical protein